MRDRPPRLLRRAGAALVHTQYAVPLRAPCPAVVTIHDLSYEDDALIGVKSTAILFGAYDRVLIAVFHVLTLLLLYVAGLRAGVGDDRLCQVIVGELEASFAVHAAIGSRLGGVHFELTGDDVTDHRAALVDLDVPDALETDTGHGPCGVEFQRQPSPSLGKSPCRTSSPHENADIRASHRT